MSGQVPGEGLPALAALHAESMAGLRVTAVSLDVFLSGDSTPQVVQDYLAAHPAPLDHLLYQKQPNNSVRTGYSA